MSYQLVCLLQQKAIPVQQSCRVLEVSRSGFYAARSRLAKLIICKTSTHLRAAFMASHQSYGSRRLVTALGSARYSSWSLSGAPPDASGRLEASMET